MCAVVCDAELTIGSVICGISKLVAKSLVNVEFDGPVAKYRLSESTRAYALEKLQAEGETQEITSRRALYLSSGSQSRPTETLCRGADQSSDLQQTLDDARSAFDWAFSPDGDPRLGVELASNLVGALLDCGMIEECCMRAALAVEALESLPVGSVDAASEMRVRAALASALPYVRGPVSKSVEPSRCIHARDRMRRAGVSCARCGTCPHAGSGTGRIHQLRCDAVSGGTGENPLELNPSASLSQSASNHAVRPIVIDAASPGALSANSSEP
jgi:hypothetical protein